MNLVSVLCIDLFSDCRQWLRTIPVEIVCGRQHQTWHVVKHSLTKLVCTSVAVGTKWHRRPLICIGEKSMRTRCFFNIILWHRSQLYSFGKMWFVNIGHGSNTSTMNLPMQWRQLFLWCTGKAMLGIVRYLTSFLIKIWIGLIPNVSLTGTLTKYFARSCAHFDFFH